MNSNAEKFAGDAANAKFDAFREVIEVENEYYILAGSTLADDRNRVLKHGETFAVFDEHGDIKPVGLGEEGVYHDGTRYLSSLILRLNRKRPLLLSSTVKNDNAFLAVDLTNPDIVVNGQVVVPRGTLHIERTKFLWNAACHERIRVCNFSLAPVDASISLHFAADFVDIFEVRGAKRSRRGQMLEPARTASALVLGYQGLDGVLRRARLELSPSPQASSSTEARYDFSLGRNESTTIDWSLTCEAGPATANRLTYDDAAQAAQGSLRSNRKGSCAIHTSNAMFNEWVNRAIADLDMMTTETPEGPYPYAGVPWFSTSFGRDGIITALELLWFDPSLARGVARFLAANQAEEDNPEQDAEPGKILHELRRGEMAALGEIPFGLYYGSVDSTPLFIMLAAAYYERTGDKSFIATIWPNIERALHWIDAYGDLDGDGFVEYRRRSSKGLTQQGWKDSQDSVFHADGTLAEPPIALCEVQGYVYAAKRGAAKLAGALGQTWRAEKLMQDAESLRERFDQAFWCEELSTYAIALDGEKRPCRVRSSNAGHCLWTGIAETQHGRRAGQNLLEPTSFSSWGIRTVAASEVRYNPMSYHNGSVWPHDNAIIAQGLARYGMGELALQVFGGLFDASLYIDLKRIPELFCGFERRAGEGPTLYPVACAPQSWAAGAVFLLLQACTGLSVEGVESRVSFAHPLLPEFLREVHIDNIKVGGATVDVRLQRHQTDVGVEVPSRQGKVQVVVVM
jgi:glycogen debranching enzyme